jgi:hypothetical protein
MFRLALIVLIPLSLTAPAHAVDVHAQSKQELASDLVDALGLMDAIERANAASLSTQLAILQRLNPGKEKELATLFNEVLPPRVQAARPAIRTELVRLHADLYSEEEIRGLTEFFRSPLGKRNTAVSTEISARLAQLTSIQGAQVWRESIGEMQRRASAALVLPPF